MPAILIVDDNAMNLELLVEKLSERGFDLHVAEDGQVALERIEALRLDLVLLDVNMPRLDGLQVLTRIRARWSLAELPVIMTTARSDRSDIVEALDLGANDYVTKPIDLTVLLARVRTQLALKDANDRLQQAQKTILDLTASAADASADVQRWCEKTCVEMGDLLRTTVTVHLDLTTRPGDTADTHAVLSPPAPLLTSDETGVVVKNASGRELGQIVVSRSPLGHEERLLVESFAAQLAAALDMRELRRELAAARERSTTAIRARPEEGMLRVCTRCGRCFDEAVTECPWDRRALDGAVQLPIAIAGRYRLTRRIAVGSTARLFAAHDDRLQRDVVLKIIKSECFEDAETRVRFEREASAAAKVRHPGVSTIHDSGELPDGSLFFVMEHLRGMDLAQLVRSYGPGAPRQIQSLVRQIGSALSAVHRAGFIHRDIKPKNIFMEEAEHGFRAKLLDFGIVKPIDEDVTLTRAGTVIGTPAYMAPEQISRSSDVDTRTDLYAFAAVTYEALVGKRVVASMNMPDVFADILHQMPAPVSEFVKGANPRLDELFRLALAKDPAARPASVEEWSHEVCELLGEIESPGGWPSRFAIDLD